MAKDTEKLIRQLSLISYLMAERRPVTATEIRRDVEGYSDMTEDAFARRFYADRAELDSLGIHLRVDRPADGFSEQENYSLAPEAFFLPAIAFTDAELAALQTALSLLDGEFAYAEPLRLALQQITWGRPSPLGSPAQRAIGLGITGSAGGAELSARLAKVDTAIYRRKRIEFEYFTMQTGETALRKVDPYELLFEGGQFYLVGHSHERGDVRVFRLSRIRGKVAYATKAEHDFQRPDGLRPARATPTASRGSSASTRGTAEIWVSDRIAWHVERNFGRYGELADADDGGGRVFRTPYAIARLVLAWAIGYGEHARVARAARAGRASCTGGSTASPSCTAASRSRASPRAARPAPTTPEDAEAPQPLARRRPAIRPERFARLVTLASVLIRAGRAGQRLAGRGGLRAAADLRAGAARGRLRAQRRQLRRRRLRALRRGPAGRRDRGRPGALLRHLRPPGAAAADRGARAARRDRAARRAPLRAPRDRAREARARARRDRQRGPAGLQRAGADDPIAREVGERDRGAPADRARVLRAERGPLLDPRGRAVRADQRPRGLVRRRPTTRRRTTCATSGSTAIKRVDVLDETYEPRADLDPIADVEGWPRTGEVGGSRVAHVWISPEQARWAREERTVLAELDDGAVIVEWALQGRALPRQGDPQGGRRRRRARARRRARGGAAPPPSGFSPPPR